MKQIEKDWKLPVKFYSASGAELTTDAETGETLQSIQILYPAKVVDVDTGEIVNRKIVVIMRRAALAELPDNSNYNKWLCFIPEYPNASADLKPYRIEEPVEGGESLGFYRFYLRKQVQST